LPIDALIRTEEALTGGSRRVLLVDDSSDIRLLLRRMLTRVSNFDVVGEASDGREAIALATNLQPDVVVLDLAMPIMDGLEALPQLRQRLPHAKIVVLSGFDEARTEQAALDAGADAYIEKGGELASFVATLELLVPLAS
jgi:DNA-binding NarL/FixJ family response regulator